MDVDEGIFVNSYEFGDELHAFAFLHLGARDPAATPASWIAVRPKRARGIHVRAPDRRRRAPSSGRAGPSSERERASQTLFLALGAPHLTVPQMSCRA